jgi:multidrug efflux pump subunit AcrA (membrane-fusion protein)
MTALHYLLPALFLTVTTTQAAELTLEAKPFTVSHNLKGTALPESFVPIRLDAKAWTTFEIVSIANHGSAVKKGEPLIVFKTDAVDRKITDSKLALAVAELGVAQAKLDLTTFEKTLPEQLLRIERSAKMAAEELAYFQETRRKASEETADQSLKRQQQLLASYQEELKQLLKMYEADEITEDTEEIILKKQHDSVASAEFALRMETLDHKRMRSVTLPRELIVLTEKSEDAALQLSKAKQDLPRSLELKKLELEKQKTALKRQRDELADLEQDRKLFEIKAPADGLFYYGSIENGTWITGDMTKVLTPKAAAPLAKNLACFIPSASKLAIESFANQGDAQALEKGVKGFAMLSGKSEVLIPVTLAKSSRIPNSQGTYSVTFTAEWPKSLNPAPGQSLDVSVISYSNEKAIAVPSKAIELGVKGWAIELKLADGKTERRVVTRGKSNGEITEITAGAEAGQVVIIP